MTAQEAYLLARAYTNKVAEGADGQDGADGVGIASITKTGTSGLVDTYTITYTNGTTSTFTVTNGSDANLTAGQYIEINNDTISVKRDISKTAQQIEYNFTIPGDYTLRVKKYLNGDLVDTTDYQFNSVVDPINLDSIMEVSKKPGGGFYWVVKNLIASTTQAADYAVELYALQQSTNYTQTFTTTIDADKKLIIKSELDAAINAIKDGQNIDSFADVEAALGEKADTDMVAADFNAGTSYTAGNYCVQDGKLYKFKNNHSGAWSSADVDEIKIAGELSSLMSGLTGYMATMNATSAVIASVAPGPNIVQFNFASIIPQDMKPRLIGYNGNDKSLNIIAYTAMQPLGDNDTQANVIVYNLTQDTYTDVTFYAGLVLVKA